ncbi:transmembrane protein C1orf162 homolog [Talpa occidentalis]|uniref:transmembrane protein C1orf162 homolog n=1 Tax=Talpa occidentalis TaxID=50954 RepID=UPI00188E3009|nr:transmembrane protein C1orf162 homolog [Talpa occidentalis]
MGGVISKTAASSGEDPSLTVAPMTTAPRLERTTSRGPEHNPNQQHLLLAFFTGILLTLLLVALVFLIIRSYRKCHSSARTLDPHSDPHLAKLSPPEEGITYASMTFKIQKEKKASSSMYHPADSDPSVYAQIKVTDSSHLAKET